MPQVWAHIIDGDLGRVAVALAKYSFFGSDIMKKSTVYGARGTVGLDRDKLAMLRATVRNICTAKSETEFSLMWQSKCIPALGSACRHMRQNGK